MELDERQEVLTVALVRGFGEHGGGRGAKNERVLGYVYWWH